jgi:diadenosine tetraphosphate (Ap4A) HIT family hydrolase
MSDSDTHLAAESDGRKCAVCDLRVDAPDESVVFASELWTATLTQDVPGWIMVTLNRHGGDWLWGLSYEEASELGPLMQRLSAAARVEAGAERVYMMGFGEKWQHFHFMLLSRSVTTPEQLRGSGLLEHAPQLADRDEALRVGSRMRDRLAASA